jgi:hypothetical protein
MADYTELRDGKAWKAIETLPSEMMDGRQVHVKRVYKGSLISEGYAVYGTPVPEAPMCQPLGPDPLGRLYDAAKDMEWAEHSRITPRWMQPDRVYAFPEPTHWRPE